MKNIMKSYLIANGWTEIRGDVDTAWQAPTGFTQTPLVFSLQDAYQLETTGEGICAYAARVVLGEALYADDVYGTETRETERYAATGVRLGTAPNY